MARQYAKKQRGPVNPIWQRQVKLGKYTVRIALDKTTGILVIEKAIPVNLGVENVRGVARINLEEA